MNFTFTFTFTRFCGSCWKVTTQVAVMKKGQPKAEGGGEAAPNKSKFKKETQNLLMKSGTEIV
jgi:hypothetical protein